MGERERGEGGRERIFSSENVCDFSLKLVRNNNGFDLVTIRSRKINCLQHMETCLKRLCRLLVSFNRPQTCAGVNVCVCMMSGGKRSCWRHMIQWCCYSVSSQTYNQSTGL